MRNGKEATLLEIPAVDTAMALTVAEEDTEMAALKVGLAAVGVLPSTV
jgi:hypothetical protein